jgi:gliding motility-associated-like protein
MSFYKANWILLPIFAFTFSSILSQTLIINEVSNGPSGNQEYVEFLVVSNNVTYDCSSAAPPCLDIRGWIFDDNSGYHGSGGVATGAIRFSQDPLWSCLPLGTIILLYNNGDPNSSLPPSDLSLSDGNCSIVVPINNTALFESNATTPGAVACSYPLTGWTAAGNWNNTLLANSGDCARIVNLSGCEVFSLCWASANQNNLIYFSSGGSGTDNVWFFNGGDPTLQNNWSEGCTDPASCGSNNQTPGAPNNAVNAAYIAQFNNGCTPILPISVSLSSTNPTCGCNGTITATPGGSIPDYTYEWFDNNMMPIGQSIQTATSLCPGNYTVSVTSSIGCSINSSITLTNSNTSTTPTFAQINPICEGATFTLPNTSENGIFGAWSPPANNLSTTTYIFTPTSSSCAITATMTVVINSNSIPEFIQIEPVCEGTTFTLPNTSENGINGSWLPTPNNLTTTTYVFTPTSNSCANSATMTVGINTSFTPVFNQIQPVCEGTSFTLPTTSENGFSGTWSPLPNNLATTSYTFTPSNGSCVSTQTMTLTVYPLPTISAGLDQTICAGQSFVLSAEGGETYSWSDNHVNGEIISPTSNETYTVTGTSPNGCTNSDELSINVQDLPIVSFEIPDHTNCAPLTLQLINTSQNANDCEWQLSNGEIYNGCDGPLITLNQTGCIDIQLISTLQGCQGSMSIQNAVCLDDQPIANFSTSTNQISELDNSVYFENESINASYYLWLFGDGNQSTDYNVSHNYSNLETDGYTVYLIAESINGCVDTTSIFIEINEELIFYVPNTFTPNSDEFNNVFKPIFNSGFEPDNYNLCIYNRWGQLIFESHNPEIGWDGSYSVDNFSAQDGTFNWKIIFKSAESDERKLVLGHVNLIR